jgi:hypothetical protein
MIVSRAFLLPSVNSPCANQQKVGIPPTASAWDRLAGSVVVENFLDALQTAASLTGV